MENNTTSARTTREILNRIGGLSNPEASTLLGFFYEIELLGLLAKF